jgi:hypothetical protein
MFSLLVPTSGHMCWTISMLLCVCGESKGAGALHHTLDMLGLLCALPASCVGSKCVMSPLTKPPTLDWSLDGTSSAGFVTLSLGQKCCFELCKTLSGMIKRAALIDAVGSANVIVRVCFIVSLSWLCGDPA